MAFSREQSLAFLRASSPGWTYHEAKDVIQSNLPMPGERRQQLRLTRPRKHNDYHLGKTYYDLHHNV